MRNILLSSIVLTMLCAPALAKSAMQEPPAPLLTKAAAPVDINHASESDLKALPGIGDAFAKKIIAGRPYSGKDDLVRRNIVPKYKYDPIANSIIAKQK